MPHQNAEEVSFYFGWCLALAVIFYSTVIAYEHAITIIAIHPNQS